jgi:predicted nucleic acid-binding protein
LKVVIDASVAVKWLFRWRADESHVAAALALLQAVHDRRLSMLQPPHFVAEVAAVLARSAGAAADRALLDLLDIEMEVISETRLYRRAVGLSSRLAHHLFDTLYHAVALETPGAVLVTADERYFRAAATEGSIARLSEFSIPA